MNQINWITDLKAIGILAVVLGHIASPFGTFIYSWHMPLFFILAGFFIDLKSSYSEYFVKSFKRLMFPYFIFCFGAILIEYFKRDLLNREQLELGTSFFNAFFYMDYNSLLGHYGHILWFLPTLFFSKLIFLFILKKINNIRLLSVLIVILSQISFHVSLPFALDESLNVLIWLFIGYFIYNHLNKIYIYVLSSLIVLLIIAFSGIPILDIANKSYSNYFINLLWASSMILIFIFVVKKINLLNFQEQINFIGFNSLSIYLIHPYTNNTAHLIVRYIIEINNYDRGLSSLYYLKFFISMSMCIGIIYIYNIFKKRIFSVKFK